jgi:hypothetical protein
VAAFQMSRFCSVNSRSPELHRRLTRFHLMPSLSLAAPYSSLPAKSDSLASQGVLVQCVRNACAWARSSHRSSGVV